MFRRNSSNINNSNLNKTVAETKAKAFDAIATSRQVHDRLDALEQRQQADGNKQTASEAVEEQAKALMEKDSSLSLSDASSQVFRENPGLYNRYRDEIGRGY